MGHAGLLTSLAFTTWAVWLEPVSVETKAKMSGRTNAGGAQLLG